MTKHFLRTIAVVLLAIFAQAETRVASAPTGAGTVFRNIAWSELNKIWLLRPNAPNTTLTITVRNRNTTNLHTFNLFVQATADESACVPASDGCSGSLLGWETVSGINPDDGLLSTSTCNIAAISVGAATTARVCRYTFFNVKQIAIIVTGAATAAGSPDTGDMFYGFTPVSMVQFPLKYTVVRGPQSPGTSQVATPVGIAGVDKGGIVRNVTTNTVGEVIEERNTGIFSAPAAGSQATITAAAGGGTVRNVAKCIGFSAMSVVAPALTAASVVLRDGATGAGTVIWQQVVTFNAATGSHFPPTNICGLNIRGSANTAMTIEFGGGVANVSQAVSLSYTTEPN